MTTKVEVHGLDELRYKYEKFPEVFTAGMKTTMTAVLLKLWEKIPGYPAQWKNSRYKRTGLLGRSIGVSEGGHKMGQPGILRIKRMGSNVHSATFGTNLKYAPRVIGERQLQMFRDRGWWNLPGVARMAEAEIVKLFEILARQLAAWMNDKGPPPTSGTTSFTVK